jgi:hypothetical protein
MVSRHRSLFVAFVETWFMTKYVSCQDHFHATHNIRIPPKTLGVKLGSDGQFPITVCKTIQQLFKVCNLVVYMKNILTLFDILESRLS